MWDTLKEKENCRKFRDGLEEAAAKVEGAIRIEDLIALLPEEQRGHSAACAGCREAANDLIKVKELFNRAASFTEERPWFAARVMAAIASRERALAGRVTAWSEFPRFASRLAWVAAIVLLASTTWFYESVVQTPSHPVNGSQESIFDAPQQSTPDDILISQAGDNP